MLTRLTHAAIAFAVTVAVYQAYVLLAAPFIEPPLVESSLGKSRGAESQAEGRRGTHKYRELLAAYFPPGHWTLSQPPITAENGQSMIVLDEFNRLDDGRLRVKKCAILFFPHGREAGEPPPSNAVVLEAPHGAVLQMDKSVHQGVGGFGRLQSGKLTGPITVRSDMREPGPHDDLLLTTREVEIRDDMIYTMGRVEMRLGAHRGSGRHLEIRLVEVERGRADSEGPNLGNIDSLVIFQDVQAELSLDGASLGRAQLTGSSRHEGTTTAAPPVQITSGGSFRFDFSKQIASFDKQVQLTQAHPQGQLDQLRCETLAVYFSQAGPATKASANSSLGKLQAALVEATSSRDYPVVFDSQSRQASGRCERLRIEPQAGRVTLDRGDRARFANQREPADVRPIQDVELIYLDNEIHAKQVQYTAPPENSQQRVGDFRASGSGWLRAQTADKPGAEPFEARWTENMRLRRINGQPVLTFNGRPRLGMIGIGQLWADHLDAYLRERPIDGSEAEVLPGDIVPERLVAGGQIAIDSAQLRGQVKELEVRFDYAVDQDSSGHLPRSSPDDNRPRTGQAELGRGRVDARRTYDISGDTLQMLVTVRHRRPEVTSIDVDGQVVFSESSSQATTTQVPPAAQAPLAVRADRLRVENADSPSAQISLNGRPATITADGMLIRTEKLQIHRGNSRAWVDVPGEIEMLMDRDLSGNRLAAPLPMTIRWQRGMELNQDRITFTGDVQVLAGEATLNTQQLVVRLSAAVQFDGAASQRQIEVAQLECSGGANAIFRQRDALGLTSVQTIMLEESFFINLQTGQLEGEGPGWLESVHLSSGDNPLGEMANGNGRGRLASTRPPPQGMQTPQAQRLRFLAVQFLRGVRGSLDSRRGRKVAVYGNVEAVYGPVDAWEQRLPLTKRGLPGRDTIWISSQSLGVAESPLARLDRSQQNGLGPIELSAQGDVTIEGPVGQRGNFTTHSREAKFDQLKKTFILEGDNRLPATLTYQEYRGAPQQNTKARKITYFQASGNVKAEGLMSGQLRQLAPAGGQ